MQPHKFTRLYLILKGKDRNQLYLKQSCTPSCFVNTSDLQTSWIRGHISTTVSQRARPIQVHQTIQPLVWTSWAQTRRQRTLEGECTTGLFHRETQLNLAGAAGALRWCENWEPHKVLLVFSPCQLHFTAGVYLLHMCGVWQPEGSYQRLWIKGYAAINTKPAGFRALYWAAFRPDGSIQEAKS